jgi:hypothetical protein
MATAHKTHEGEKAAAGVVRELPPTLLRLDDQIEWYDTKSQSAQRRFKIMKALVISGAAAIPVVSAFQAPIYVPGILGAFVVVVEGLLSAYQYHTNWLTYRSTAEALKHEKYLYLAKADVYSRSRQPLRLLAQRIEGLISQEHGRWISSLSQHDREHEEADDSESA